MITTYELKYKNYVGVQCETVISYGGNQKWFKENNDIGSVMIGNGCGVIAASDLLLYITQISEGRINGLSKSSYKDFVRKIQYRYVPAFYLLGTFPIELTLGINRYFKEKHYPLKAVYLYRLRPLELYQKVRGALLNNHPVIMMIGQTSPIIMSRIKKEGITFFRKIDKGFQRSYEAAIKNVYGHFVVITGMYIDEEETNPTYKIMFKISSWGETYYISYKQYCYYMKYQSKRYLCGIITV